MDEQLRLETDRLVLRRFSMLDAEYVARLAGDWEIAATTGAIPHPYTLNDARIFISKHNELFESKRGLILAVTLKENSVLVGSIGLFINYEHQHGELGYWIGKEHWNKGYCTEASLEILRFGFEIIQLNRIQSCHFGSNPASGRVMQKIGMKYEGRRPEYYHRWDKFQDQVLYGILKKDWKQ